MQIQLPTPVKTPKGVDIYTNELVDYWNTLYPNGVGSDETIRIVRQIKEANGEYGKFGYITETIQINNVIQLAEYINNLQSRNKNLDVGISISAAIFQYEKDTRPSIKTFKRTKRIAVDIDTHINRTKNRFELGNPFISEDQIQISIMQAWNQINKKFIQHGIDPVKPVGAMLTGGGLQLIFDFDKELNKSEADKLFGLLKNVIGKLDWKTVILGVDDYQTVEFDIDPTFSDISHVQRVAGVINQKYGTRAKFIDIFDLSDSDIVNLIQSNINRMNESLHIEDRKKLYANELRKIQDDFLISRNKARNSIEVQNNLMTAKMQASRTIIKPSELQSVEYDLLTKMKEVGIRALDLLAGEVKIGATTGNLTKLYCPFHEEQNPSMAFYENDLIDVFKDFHDDKTYNLVSFWMKLFDIPKSTALSQISEKSKIKLGKTERKNFQNLEVQEIIEELIKRVDTENYVYYRLANKNRTCVVRHIDSGESFIFDGPKMLATHVLTNQLNVNDADKQLLEMFIESFQQSILIEAFEEFRPGKPTLFQKQFIKFVNLWVPNERYKRVHKLVEEEYTENYNLTEAIEMIQDRCPWTYNYILQLVQKGDIEWFINWLSAVSKFKVMPTVPVIFGVQGAGKNLFVSTIMDYYLNNEYVKILNGDRIMNNFNSVLETANLIVLDEGDFSSGKEVDQLKLLTGNSKILIEKKGVDASNKDRHFNFLFFSNGDVPVRHPAMDRRITYFKNEISLLRACSTWGLTIDQFIELVKTELADFWAIVYKTELSKDMTMANNKNGQFWEQIMKMHPFGNLIMKLINREWEDIALQLNENVSDPSIMTSNLNLLKTIQDQFRSSGKLSLTLINRYLQSMNYKVKTSIQHYIQVNHLDEFGISIQVTEEDVFIVINKEKVRNAVRVENVLLKKFPEINKQAEESGLEAEVEENTAVVHTETSGLVAPELKQI